MGRILLNAIWVVLTVLGTAVPATVAANSAEHRIGPSMLVGRITSQPIGHYVFCRSHRDECQADRDASPSRVTEYGWSVVREINVEVNRAILPMTDSEIYGEEEVWTYPDAMGDCEDYVLLKRALLIERGFPASDLLITVVRKRNGEGHAVLTLRSDEGDYVLDNLDDEVRLWTDTPYTYLKRQASFHAGRWVKIENGDELTVGSIPNQNGLRFQRHHLPPSRRAARLHPAIGRYHEIQETRPHGSDRERDLSGVDDLGIAEPGSRSTPTA